MTYIILAAGTAAGLYRMIITRKLKLSEVPFEMIAVLTLALPVGYLSLNPGQYCAYILQIIEPFMIFSALLYIRFILTWIRQKNHLAGYALYILLIVLIGKNIYDIYDRYSVNPFGSSVDNYISEWKKAYAIADSFDPEYSLYGIQFADYAFTNGYYTDDLGQNEYNRQQSLDNYEKNSMYRILFPYYPAMVRISTEYNNLVRQRINEGYYSFIAVPDSPGTHTTASDPVPDSYTEFDTIDLYTGSQKLTVHFYKLPEN